MTFDDVIKQKVHVKIKETDVRQITLHEDIAELLNLFGMVKQKITFVDYGRVGQYRAEFIQDKIPGFVTTGSYYSRPDILHTSKHVRFYNSDDSNIDEILAGIRNGALSSRKDAYILLIDKLRTCSVYIESDEEINYPIYRVFKIFENRRKAEKTKEKTFKTKKLEHHLMGMALASEIDLDELCNYEFIENSYEEKNIHNTFYYKLLSKHVTYYIFSNDKWETCYLKCARFSTDWHLSKENLKKLLTTLKEIKEL